MLRLADNNGRKGRVHTLTGATRFGQFRSATRLPMLTMIIGHAPTGAAFHP
jgi:hypothetical protein